MRSDDAKNGDATDESFDDASLFFFLLNNDASETYKASSTLESSGLFLISFVFIV